MTQDYILSGCALATMVKGAEPYGLINDAALVVQGGRIKWCGPSNAVPADFAAFSRKDLEGRVVTPSLIDCHTHLVFGGNRAREFEMRLGGATYEEISRAGGGIVSTVKATRNATEEELVAGALGRLDDLMSEGVTVVEIKSGYGLTIEDEIRMLRVARHLETLRPVKIVTTWLAAHALPPEYAKLSDSYIEDVVILGLEIAASKGLVDAVDVFCEKIAFSPAQTERVFKAAQKLGLPVKLHAEQLSDQKGALLTARYNGLSADHLEYLAENDVPAFAASDAVAVLLPGAFYTLKETKLPPIEALRKHNVDLALATDCNPGSSPISSILTIMNMACVEFSMTPEEALAGVTRCGAKALGLSEEYGQIAIGRTAELAIWDVKHPSELSYWVGKSPLFKTISQGLIA